MYSVYVRVYACARELGWKSKEGSGGESVARQLACLGPPPICARAGVLNLSGRRAPDNVSMHGITRRRSSLSFLALYIPPVGIVGKPPPPAAASMPITFPCTCARARILLQPTPWVIYSALAAFLLGSLFSPSFIPPDLTSFNSACIIL